MCCQIVWLLVQMHVLASSCGAGAACPLGVAGKTRRVSWTGRPWAGRHQASCLQRVGAKHFQWAAVDYPLALQQPTTRLAKLRSGHITVARGGTTTTLGCSATQSRREWLGRASTVGVAMDRNSTQQGPKSLFPKGPSFTLDDFSNKDFIVRDFVDKLAENAVPINRRSGQAATAFDPKPLIRTFESAYRL